MLDAVCRLVDKRRVKSLMKIAKNHASSSSLPTGVYTIENVKNRNWAILLNDDDRSEVIAGTDDNVDAGEKVSSLTSQDTEPA